MKKVQWLRLDRWTDAWMDAPLLFVRGLLLRCLLGGCAKTGIMERFLAWPKHQLQSTENEACFTLSSQFPHNHIANIDSKLPKL